ncbi:MAG TPA: nitrilase-related carbon-nitrogen hydrolase [Methylomirabilota bacterium]|nr:nitrilase-related carbon-nitrogen hydrolase [Methylomirabilota bacterium]
MSVSTETAVCSARAFVPFRPLTLRGFIAWGLGAAAALHVAYEFFPPAILLFLFCIYQLAHAATRPHAMYSGWVLGLLIYGPQLAFFWNIFGFAAVALWLVLATWLSAYLVLQRFALLKLGPQLGAWAAPFLWTGVEYFRSELYYLRFSWVNVGYAFSPFPQQAFIPWLGMYGIGFLLMLFAAHAPFHRTATRQQKLIWTTALALAAIAAFLPGSSAEPERFSPKRGNAIGTQLKIAGVQLEFADERTVVAELDKLLAKCPDANLFVLSEYTFSGPVPSPVKSWCATNRKYLIAGGKDYLDASESEFRNTAFVIDPEGREIFKQAKAVPIQFFKDGQPAAEQNVWNSPWGKLGVCVCYDLSYTRVTDELIRQGAQAIVVPTMDVEDWGERQHHLHARVAPVRAAEYGVPIFRLCSSGLSQAVNRDGTVQATAPFPGQGATLEATLEVPERGGLPMDRILVWPCVGISVSLLVWHLLHSFRPARHRTHARISAERR